MCTISYFEKENQALLAHQHRRSCHPRGRIASQELVNKRAGLLTLQDQSSGSVRWPLSASALEEREAHLEEVKHSLQRQQGGGQAYGVRFSVLRAQGRCRTAQLARS